MGLIAVIGTAALTVSESTEYRNQTKFFSSIVLSHAEAEISPPTPEYHAKKGLQFPSMPWATRVSDPEALYANQSKMPVEVAVLTTAPNVPPPITRRHPVLLKVDLTTEIKKIQLNSKYKYEAWTFNGSVPGPMIRARVGDVVELSLLNLDDTGNPHNIDCHGFEGIVCFLTSR